MVLAQWPCDERFSNAMRFTDFVTVVGEEHMSKSCSNGVGVVVDVGG